MTPPETAAEALADFILHDPTCSGGCGGAGCAHKLHTCECGAFAERRAAVDALLAQFPDAPGVVILASGELVGLELAVAGRNAHLLWPADEPLYRLVPSPSGELVAWEPPRLSKEERGLMEGVLACVDDRRVVTLTEATLARALDRLAAPVSTEERSHD